MKMKKHLILSMLLLGFAGMLEAEKTNETKTQKPNKGLTILLAGRRSWL